MNAFLTINRWAGVLFGCVVVAGVIYVGSREYGKARQRLHDQGQAYVNEMVLQAQQDLPPGLNGEYPANGPLAEFYRENPAGDGSYIPVAPY